MNITYDHVFVDHLDQPVQLQDGETFRVLETQVSLSTDGETATYVFAHRVAAL